MGGEIDELEEGRGMINFPALKVSWVVEEEELVDKPGTTIGTKFSVLHLSEYRF